MKPRLLFVRTDYHRVYRFTSREQPAAPLSPLSIISTTMSLLSSSLRSLRSATRSTTQRRLFAAMPKPQSMEAELWEGHPKHKEGWESTIYLTYGVATVLLTLTLFAPETSIQTWASAEAQARLDQKDAQFGKHHSAPEIKYDFNSGMADNPLDEEDDDDDEEEEEEVDEDEEEEEDEE